MKTVFFRLLVVLSLFLTVFIFNSVISDVGIDLKNCQPANFISKLKRAYDPLVFSVKQHQTLESFIGSALISEALDVCVRTNTNDKLEMNKCIDSVHQQQKNVKSCYDFWTFQCRANGGKC